jgi:hypothetical protein
VIKGIDEHRADTAYNKNNNESQHEIQNENQCPLRNEYCSINGMRR